MTHKIEPLLLILILSCFIGASQGLRVGFYADTCPNAESIVRRVVSEAASSEQNAPPVLLRLHFHDCFINGCDGSILITTGLETDERSAFGHQGVQGFEIIERAKAQLEATCPGIVSCADIVTLAARDAVFLTKGPMYEVPTGRRDGLVSNKSLADNMPDITDSIDTLKAKFSEKGLSGKDLVLLSSAHSIGTTACFFMTNRLYEFTAGGGSDPSINPGFLPELKATCPQNGNPNTRLAMNRGSGQTFGKQILQNIRSGFAVLETDARLYEDAETKRVVDSYFGFFRPFLGPSFEADFAKAMVKMGEIGVLTGSEGEIRRVCSSFN